LTPCLNKAFVSAKSRGEYAQCPREINGSVRGIGRSADLIQPQTVPGLGLSMSTNSPWSRSVHGRALATATDCPRTVHGLELSVHSPRTQIVQGHGATANRPCPNPSIGPRLSAAWPYNVHTCCRRSFRIVRLESLELSAATNARSVLTVPLRPRGRTLPVRSSRATFLNCRMSGGLQSAARRRRCAPVSSR
jgi:hypothetical protein